MESSHVWPSPVPGWRVTAAPTSVPALTVLSRVAREGWLVFMGPGPVREDPDPLMLFGRRTTVGPVPDALLAAVPSNGLAGTLVAAELAAAEGAADPARTPADVGPLLAGWLRAADPARASITPRQRQCLALVSQGRRVREIANHLGLSVSAVEQYLRAARQRLGARTRADAVARAVRLGLLERPASRTVSERIRTITVMAPNGDMVGLPIERDSPAPATKDG